MPLFPLFTISSTHSTRPSHMLFFLEVSPQVSVMKDIIRRHHLETSAGDNKSYISSRPHQDPHPLLIRTSSHLLMLNASFIATHCSFLLEICIAACQWTALPIACLANGFCILAAWCCALVFVVEYGSDGCL